MKIRLDKKYIISGVVLAILCNENDEETRRATINEDNIKEVGI